MAVIQQICGPPAPLASIFRLACCTRTLLRLMSWSPDKLGFGIHWQGGRNSPAPHPRRLARHALSRSLVPYWKLRYHGHPLFALIYEPGAQASEHGEVMR
jgi:hypothetical protein